MTDYQPRIITTFESSDGLTVLTFPRAEYEWESSQGLYVPEATLVGAGYTYDQLGNSIAPRQSGRETLRFVILETDPATVDTTTDDIVSKALLIGRGKLWTTDKNGARQWAWARALSLPTVSWRAGDIFTRTAAIEFRRMSDWQAASATTVTGTIDATPKTFSVSNSGNQRLYNATLTLRGTFTSPVVVNNTTTGYQFTYNGMNGTVANDWIRFDSGSGRCFRSTDGGATWDDDDGSLTLGASQAQIMRLDAGSNSLTVTDSGAPNASLDVTFYPAT